MKLDAKYVGVKTKLHLHVYLQTMFLCFISFFFVIFTCCYRLAKAYWPVSVIHYLFNTCCTSSINKVSNRHNHKNNTR